jgi:uncharacterized protein
MIIPHESLERDTLYALIEEFVARDGAVHGHSEMSLAAKMQAVLRQLEAGKAVIVFDAENETCSIVLSETLAVQQRQAREATEE